MISLKSIYITVIALCWIVYPFYSVADEAGSVEAAKQQVERLVKAEFDGYVYMRNEPDLVKFSAELKSYKDANIEGARTFLDLSPLLVVSSYEIVSVKMKKNHARAIVTYTRLARTKGIGSLNRKLMPNLIKREMVQYDLIFDGVHWLILAPPLPRVSKEAMLGFYEDRVTSFSKFIDDPDTSKAQRKQFQKDNETLKILKSLSD